MNLRLPNLSNYSLEQAAGLIGCTDDYLISLGVDGKLKFYVRPKNWAYRKHSDPLTAYIINCPILIDDPVFLEKLLNGVESVMYFSAQYPDSFLEDLDEIEAAEFVDNLELSTQQIATLKAGKKVSVVRDEVSTQLGVPIIKDRLVIKLEDLEPFLPKQQQSKVKAVWNAGTGSETQDERRSQLYIFIWRVHQVLNQQKRPTAQQVWREIQHHYTRHDTDKIIQDVDGERILWVSGYGNEQRQLRSTFDKTLSNIRKDPPF